MNALRALLDVTPTSGMVNLARISPAFRQDPDRLRACRPAGRSCGVFARHGGFRRHRWSCRRYVAVAVLHPIRTILRSLCRVAVGARCRPLRFRHRLTHDRPPPLDRSDEWSCFVRSKRSRSHLRRRMPVALGAIPSRRVSPPSCCSCMSSQQPPPGSSLAASPERTVTSSPAAFWCPNRAARSVAC